MVKLLGAFIILRESPRTFSAGMDGEGSTAFLWF